MQALSIKWQPLYFTITHRGEYTAHYRIQAHQFTLSVFLNPPQTPSNGTSTNTVAVT